MFSLSKSLLATFVAWLSGSALIMAYSYATKAASSWTATPVTDVLKGLSILAYFVGIVVFPTCLLVVTPLLRLLPRTSLLWRPSLACTIGAIAGPIAMYLWTAGFRRSFFIPEPHDSAHLLLGICSAVTGTVFAYSYTRGVAQGYSANAKPFQQ